jgi:ribosome-associated protein
MDPSPEPAFDEADDKFLHVTRAIRIPIAEFSFSFARSGGPGGQNVNKVSSKAILRWRVAETASLDEEVRARFMAENRHRITSEGDLVITSQRYRDQPRNIVDCREKLQALLVAAAKRPVPRKKTKPTAGSRRRRLADKRKHSARKELRRRPMHD